MSHRSVSIRVELMERVQAFVKTNRDGYSSAADVVSAAIRRFLEVKAEAPSDLEDVVHRLVKSEVRHMLADAGEPKKKKT